MANIQQTHGIRAVDKIGYALGDLGGILTFSLVSSFLTMFYTDILGISTASITVLMLVARIWDAVNDPMWGAFIDSRKPTMEESLAQMGDLTQITIQNYGSSKDKPKLNDDALKQIQQIENVVAVTPFANVPNMNMSIVSGCNVEA